MEKKNKTKKVLLQVLYPILYCWAIFLVALAISSFWMSRQSYNQSYLVMGIVSLVLAFLFTFATVILCRKYPIKEPIVTIILLILAISVGLFTALMSFIGILIGPIEVSIIFIIASLYIWIAVFYLLSHKEKRIKSSEPLSPSKIDKKNKDLTIIPKTESAPHLQTETIEQIRLREAQEYTKQFNQFHDSRAIAEKQEQTNPEFTQKDSSMQRAIDKEVKKRIKDIERNKKIEIDRIKREQKQYYDIQVNKLAQSLAEKKAKELVRQEEERKKRVERSRVYELYQTANHKLAECDSMNGFQFERFCGNLLRNNGFRNVEVTQGSGDYGIDILAEKDEVTYAIQCKCYSSKIGNKVIQEVYSGKAFYNRMVGVIMTNNYFTQSAIDTAKKTKILLWNRDKIKDFICSSSN